MSVAVLYVDRWCNKPYFSRAFLNSMIRHAPGADYEYVHVMKGFERQEPNDPILEYMRDSGRKTHIFHVADDRPALGVMSDVVQELPHEKVLLFMSWSRILAPDWLRHYLNAFDTEPGCGMVGASGGYERRNLKDLSEPFPNIGIRSTGFMMDRKMFLEMGGRNIMVRWQENDFEAGSNGMTKQIMRRGLKPVIIDRWGKTWHIEDWPRSKTFRSGFQEGALIKDNRTYQYDVLSNKKRRWLAEINWGTAEYVPWASPIRRLDAYLDWHYRGK